MQMLSIVAELSGQDCCRSWQHRGADRRLPMTMGTGRHLGYSTWQRITQKRINRFTAVTGDCQWIHVAPRRAAREPFGATIAHGFLTLARFPPLLKEILHVHGALLAINYGLNQLRFPAPCRPARRRGWAWSWSAPNSAPAASTPPSALPSRCTAKPTSLCRRGGVPL